MSPTFFCLVWFVSSIGWTIAMQSFKDIPFEVSKKQVGITDSILVLKNGIRNTVFYSMWKLFYSMWELVYLIY